MAKAKAKKTRLVDLRQKYIIMWLAVIVVGLVAALTAGIDQVRYDYAHKTATVSPKELVETFEGYKRSYLSLTEEDAVSKANHDGFTSRVVDRGDKNQQIVITDDLRDDRVNFTVIDERVTRVEFY